MKLKRRIRKLLSGTRGIIAIFIICGALGGYFTLLGLRGNLLFLAFGAVIIIVPCIAFFLARKRRR
ncbi:MAG: hypothetical protein ACP6IU_13025 [Candidatus Asgardarchaeia archaeon]